MQPDFLGYLLQMPGLLLIGIDPESHAVLLTGQAARSITLDQLTKIMRNRDATSPEQSMPPSSGNEPVAIKKTFPTQFFQGENHEHENES